MSFVRFLVISIALFAVTYAAEPRVKLGNEILAEHAFRELP